MRRRRRRKLGLDQGYGDRVKPEPPRQSTIQPGDERLDWLFCTRQYSGSRSRCRCYARGPCALPMRRLVGPQRSSVPTQAMQSRRRQNDCPKVGQVRALPASFASYPLRGEGYPTVRRQTFQAAMRHRQPRARRDQRHGLAWRAEQARPPRRPLRWFETACRQPRADFESALNQRWRGRARYRNKANERPPPPAVKYLRLACYAAHSMVAKRASRALQIAARPIAPAAQSSRTIAKL